jgi:hypothetical protein
MRRIRNLSDLYALKKLRLEQNLQRVNFFYPLVAEENSHGPI